MTKSQINPNDQKFKQHAVSLDWNLGIDNWNLFVICNLDIGHYLYLRFVLWDLRFKKAWYFKLKTFNY